MKLNFHEDYQKYLRSNVKINSSYEEHAELILNNRLFLHTNLEILQFKDDFDWDYQHKQSINTYQVYIQSLTYINPLLKMYELTKNDIYYNKAEAIISSWLDYQRTSTKKIVWNEHPVSSRLLSFLYFLSLKEAKVNLYQQIVKSIKEHLDFLTDPKNYKPNNHGLMMDKAILVSSLFIDDEKIREQYIDVAKNRIEKLIYRDYSYEGVHLENSPEYHLMVTNILKHIINVLKELYPSIDYRINNIFKKANLYLPHIVNCKGELPLIGDTSYMKLNIEKSYNDFLDYEAGICVFNDQSNQSTLIFNSGFRSATHKQLGDLSFVFSKNKNNIFIDGGKYCYDSKSDMVKFINSLLAHNSFSTRNMRYSNANLNVAKIINSRNTEDYKYVAGQISLDNKILTRHLVLLNDDSIIIFDQGRSDKEEEWIQNFLLHDSLSVHELNNKNFLLKNDNVEAKLQFDNSFQNVLFGRGENACYSMYFDKLIDTHRIENISFGSDCKFLTAFIVDSNKEYEVTCSGNILSINTLDYQIKIDLF